MFYGAGAEVPYRRHKRGYLLYVQSQIQVIWFTLHNKPRGKVSLAFPYRWGILDPDRVDNMSMITQLGQISALIQGTSGFPPWASI